MNSSYLACALTFTTLLGMPHRAIAQAPAPPAAAPSASPSASPTERAAVAYKQGVQLYIQKRWREAEAAFSQAWALNPTADVAYNLGSAEFHLGKHSDAAGHLAFALRTWPLMEAMSKQRPIAEQRLRDARASVGALTVTVNVERA